MRQLNLLQLFNVQIGIRQSTIMLKYAVKKYVKQIAQTSKKLNIFTRGLKQFKFATFVLLVVTRANITISI